MTVTDTLSTPEEAKDWEIDYVPADEVKVGDYLVRNGFFKVFKVTTFKPYDSVQIVGRSETQGQINFAFRETNTVWVLQEPR